MITEQKILDMFDEALRLFGEYTIGDKDILEEFMDVNTVIIGLKAYPPQQILTMSRNMHNNHRCPDELIAAIARGLEDDSNMSGIISDPLFSQYL
jgi:hypothetical protein